MWLGEDHEMPTGKERGLPGRAERPRAPASTAGIRVA